MTAVAPRTLSVGCSCQGPESCGIAGILPEGHEKPCHICRQSTPLVTRCGLARCRHVHPYPPASTNGTGSEATTQRRRPAPAARGDDTGDKPLRLLAALEGDLPTRQVGNVAKPARLCPPLPGITNLVHVVTGYAWQRKTRGPVVRLDRNAAFLSAASSVLVAHGELEHTGPLSAFNPNRPGYYLVPAHPWQFERVLPNPLGRRNVGEQVWVPAPTLQLLTQLADAGMWGDVEVLDSYTATGARLDRWTSFIRDLRADILRKYGPESDQYGELKDCYSQAITLMAGVDNPGQGRTYKCKTHRPDWTHTIHAQASATLWRLAWQCSRLADEGPVALVNTDELHLPESIMAAVCTDAKTRDKAKPIRIDNEGLTLGTFKIKGK